MSDLANKAYIQYAIQHSDLKGEKGDTGAAGPQGAKGDAGDTGPQGIQGSTGATGSTGAQGNSVEYTWNGTRLGIRIEGDASYTYVDLKGATGDTGAAGAKGETGEQGAQGIQGATGETGATGAKGDTGNTGATGNGISSVILTSGNHAAGTTDTYTITFTDSTATTFTVYNGADGTGSGNMLKSTYDTDNDGKVDSSESADTLSASLDLSLGGTGGTSASTGLYNLINGLSAVTPVSADKIPFLDASGSTAGFVTLDHLLTALSGLGAAKIEAGVYTGTGVFGSASPNSLTFSFSPKLVVVRIYSLKTSFKAIIGINGMTDAGAWGAANGQDYSVIFTWSGNTVAWYSGVSIANQFNGSGVAYYYVAIG
ncbi:hypothetical protein SDC9_117731 [bioreactor metagenome]|uniref:Collagen-like protein n=1 Tax=bioreactor metagenome TaxID=1076179 RepID=A0A645C1H4_9ZZZZ